MARFGEADAGRQTVNVGRWTADGKRFLQGREAYYRRIGFIDFREILRGFAIWFFSNICQ